jgi:hypothetical protein
MVPAAAHRLRPRLAAMPATLLLASLRHATLMRLASVGMVRCCLLRFSGVGFSVGVTWWLGNIFFRKRGALAGVRAMVGGEPAADAT